MSRVVVAAAVVVLFLVLIVVIAVVVDVIVVVCQAWGLRGLVVVLSLCWLMVSPLSQVVE